MAADSRCSFCQRLPPTARTRGGKRAKCPVCKGALLVASETTYRLMTTAEMALEPKVAGSRRWKPAVLLALAACLVLTVWLGKQFLLGGNGPAKEIPIVPLPESTARIPLPVEPRFAMVSPQVRPIPAANPAELVVARKPVDDKVALKPIPENVFPCVKDNNSTVRTSLAKVFPALSSSKAFMKQSRFASLFADRRPQTLAEVPEIDLDKYPTRTSVSQKVNSVSAEYQITRTSVSEKVDSVSAKYQIARKVEEILKVTKDEPDAFVKQIKNRADLAGLPFVMGEQCRLSSQLARSLQVGSRSIRMSLDRTRRENSKNSYYNQSADSGVRFWESMRWDLSAKTLPALEQILLAESASHRELFMKKLKKIETAAATRILAQRAIFDLDADVRETALETLKNRPPDDVTPFLLQGLRYPWPQVVHRSAEAIVKLNRTDLLPKLVDMLDQPDPDAPFVGGPKKDRLMVRELVRVNHHRNCLLCHAPVDLKDRRDRSVFTLPLGPIPIPGEPMPTSAVVYYSLRNGESAVRADVTYLRQDFSLMQPVAYPGPWPAEQRYDFLVRVRALKDAEVFEYKNRMQPKQTAYKTPIALALKALTGQDGGYSAEAWRQLLDPKLEKAWRSPCTK